MNVARALIASLLIGLMTVTPLSAALEPGRHETRFPAQGTVAALPVTLDDRTGLVAGIGLGRPSFTDGVSNAGDDHRSLIVGWLGGACDHHVWLLFERRAGGFRLAMRTQRAGGCTLQGIDRAVVLQLRAPVDAAVVAFEPD